ncbi:MAG: ATP-dependent RecD-like DNA helicase, partial [Clostridia bacterium]|nr:ATP-dependent RecD-like DNA helicase [Clostridia bacterium]
METFRGIVDKIIYTNAETGYTVLAFNAKRNMFVAVGTLPPIEENEYLKITGDFVQNKRYGTQFNIKEVEFDHPDSKNEIYIYLSSGLFYGIGEKTAKLIVDYFGEKTFEILDNDPERLMEVPGIGIKKVKAIIEAYENTKVMKESIIFLQKYDISLGLAIKIYKRYGESTIAIVRENPYILATDLKGIGFITADRIAKNIGISETSDFRIMAGIRHILTEEATSAGHTCLPEAKLLEATRKLLNIDLDIIKKVYDYTPDLIREVVDDEILVSVSVNYYIEQAIAY